MKSHDLCDRVIQALKNRPLDDPELAHCTAATFPYVDHDEKLLAALHLVMREFAEGRETHAGSLTQLFFPQQAVVNGDAFETVKLMQDMWGFRFIGGKLLLAESRPRQLEPLLEKMLSAPDDASYARLKAAFKAFAVHDATDLMGVAAPDLPVYYNAVVKRLLQLFEDLGKYADELREKKTTSPLDVKGAARDFFRKRLPQICEAGEEEIRSLLCNSPNEMAGAKVLIGSLASSCVLGTDEKKFMPIWAY